MVCFTVSSWDSFTALLWIFFKSYFDCSNGFNANKILFILLYLMSVSSLAGWSQVCFSSKPWKTIRWKQGWYWKKLKKNRQISRPCKRTEKLLEYKSKIYAHCCWNTWNHPRKPWMGIQIWFLSGCTFSLVRLSISKLVDINCLKNREIYSTD